ncbi:MAG: DNA-binding protein, partial [Anaerolineae bacterium]
IADLLEGQNANPFRIRAYREGAATIRAHEDPVADFIRQDEFEALKALPGIGEGIAAVIGEYVSLGESSLLAELKAGVSPESVLTTVPGIGDELAERIVEQLDVHTLPELEEAAHDGRLDTVEGFGSRRVEGVRKALAGMLNRSAKRQVQNPDGQDGKVSQEAEPSVELLLQVDADYRKQAKAGELHKIAPRRFNPKKEAWLPVFHTKRQGWMFTVMFSNTAQAHALGKTDDWVVIYYKRGDHEGQNTVVTETKTQLKGKRVVRGRQAENQHYYEVQSGG